LRRYFIRSKHKNEKGQSLVEFALVLPILVLLILGIIDFGMIFHGYVTVNTAAREGARHGVVEKYDDENGEEEVVDVERVVDVILGVTGTLPGGDSKLEILINGETAYENEEVKSPTFPGSGDDMKITVIYDYELITPLPAFTGISDALNLTGEITMVRE